VKTMIVGCGRVGAGLAGTLAKAGHQVTILDISSRAFDRLPSDFGGTAVRGNGIDEDVLRRAGIDGSDVFVALTEGDNRNVLMAQLARETFAVPKVVAKVNDPVRAEAYAALGLATLCRTSILENAVLEYLGERGDGIRGVVAPSGHDHPLEASPAPAPAAAAPTTVRPEATRQPAESDRAPQHTAPSGEA
jgi:trk system potassium uptake protein